MLQKATEITRGSLGKTIEYESQEKEEIGTKTSFPESPVRQFPTKSEAQQEGIILDFK